MFKGRSRRSGFTLPEVLVTVAIVAVLAAVVVPTVTSQLDKGDAPALQSSIGSLRTGVTAFVTDVKKFPRRLSHLVNAVSSGDSALGLSTYGNGANHWKGPYAAYNLTSGDSLLLGMNLKAFDSLSVVSNQIEVRLTGSTSNAEMQHIDSLIDNGTGASAGSLRWTNTSGVASALKYYLMGSQ